MSKVMIQADYSKAETWVVASLADDARMLNDLKNGDFHSDNASNILGKKVDKSMYTDYQLGKRVGHGCWSGDAEVLTKKGWIRFDELEDNIEVAQWDTDTSAITFTTPSHVTRAHYEGEMYQLTGTSYATNITHNHRMLFKTYNDTIREQEVSDFIVRKSARLPITGDLDGANAMHPDFLRLLVAVQADGCIVKTCNSIHFNFTKQRKVQRLVAILDSLGYSYSNTRTDNGNRILLHKQAALDVKAYLTKDKVFGAWLLELTKENLRIFITEIMLWDGYVVDNATHKQRVYTSVNKQNACWVQTIAHLTGHQALIRRHEPRELGWQPQYKVSINNAKHAQYKLMRTKTTAYNGLVYCVTVPTGAFMVRYNGNIMVSGNSNYGMTPFLLQAILAKDGYSYNKTETADLMEKYHAAYQGIRGCYHQGVKDDLSRDMTLTNPFGRKITFWDFWGTRLMNKAFAWLPQSTIGDMTNRALCNVYENMGKYVDLRLQCHDSLVMQLDASNLTTGFLEDLQANMSFPLTVKNTTFTVPIDVEVGMNWYEMDELYVKDGSVWVETKPEHLTITDWMKGKGL